MSVDYMNLNGEKCPCGKNHTLSIDKIFVGSKAILNLVPTLKEYGAKSAFILSDINTEKVAGSLVKDLLNKENISFSSYIFKDEHLKPDEKAVGSAVMNFKSTADVIIAVGSGVINDIGKILSTTSGKKYIIVATAPSMDGYASMGSSMELAGVKTSVDSKCPSVIIGDTDILKNAPLNMLKSGLGDMIAKMISIGEWRISNLIVNEYYCENVAKLMKSAVKRCVDNAEGLLKRDEKAVEAVFEGLIIAGAAMAYAGISRPASGVEHYFSHVWDMRGLEFGTSTDSHGIQCAIASLYAAKLYDKIRSIKPDREKAISYIDNFSLTDYHSELRAFLGKGAETMIELEKKEQKYNKEKHLSRLEIILDNFDKIIDIINEEIPESSYIENLLNIIDAPKKVEDIDIPSSILPLTFKATKDIRDKYVLSRLCFDLGIIDEMSEILIK